MAIEQTSHLTGNSSPADRAGAPLTYSASLKLFVFALFFSFGGITSLNDILVPKLKSLFTLSYAEGMLVQSAFFAAYFVISLPAAALVRRIGYLRAAAVGLLTMTAGCLLFVPASSFGVFALFLLALFVLAAGITTVQVVSNPLISMLGPLETASSRLTFAQAFNSLGTTLFPYFGSILILGTVAAASSTGLIQCCHRGVPLRGNPGHRSHLFRTSRRALRIGRRRLDAAPLTVRGTAHRHVHPACLRVTPSPPFCVRCVVYLSLRRRRSRDWLTDRQLPDAGRRLRRRRAGGPASTCRTTGAAPWWDASSAPTSCGSFPLGKSSQSSRRWSSHC